MASIGIVIVLLFAAAGATYAGTKRAAHRRRLIADAEMYRDEDDLEAAVTAAEKALPYSTGLPLHRALFVLGICAERRADLTNAVAMFDRALKALPVLSSPAEPIVDALVSAIARRAFALAALDRVPEAEADLALVAKAARRVATYGLIVRARALVLSKRGLAKELLDLLESEREAIRETLSRRDRALMNVLGARARTTLTGSALRSAASPRAFDDPKIATWIEAVFPEARVLGGGLS